jgi:hypothetical protein
MPPAPPHPPAEAAAAALLRLDEAVAALDPRRPRGRLAAAVVALIASLLQSLRKCLENLATIKATGTGSPIAPRETPGERRLPPNAEKSLAGPAARDASCQPPYRETAKAAPPAQGGDAPDAAGPPRAATPGVRRSPAGTSHTRRRTTQAQPVPGPLSQATRAHPPSTAPISKNEAIGRPPYCGQFVAISQ